MLTLKKKWLKVLKLNEKRGIRWFKWVKFTQINCVLLVLTASQNSRRETNKTKESLSRTWVAKGRQLCQFERQVWWKRIGMHWNGQKQEQKSWAVEGGRTEGDDRRGWYQDGAVVGPTSEGGKKYITWRQWCKKMRDFLLLFNTHSFWAKLMLQEVILTQTNEISKPNKVLAPSRLTPLICNPWLYMRTGLSPPSSWRSKLEVPPRCKNNLLHDSFYL